MYLIRLGKPAWAGWCFLFLGMSYLSKPSSGQCVNVVVGVYGFSLITSVDSRVVCSLTLCTIDPGSAPSTEDLILRCSGHIPQPTIRCQSRSVYSSMSNPLLVEPAGAAPASCTLFGLLHTTISLLYYLLRNLSRQIGNRSWSIQLLQSVPGFFGGFGPYAHGTFLCSGSGISHSGFP